MAQWRSALERGELQPTVDRVSADPRRLGSIQEKSGDGWSPSVLLFARRAPG